VADVPPAPRHVRPAAAWRRELRIKIPQGVLTGPQLEALAQVGERFSRGFGHITPG